MLTNVLGYEEITIMTLITTYKTEIRKRRESGIEYIENLINWVIDKNTGYI